MSKTENNKISLIKDIEYGYLINSLIYEALLHTYIISASKINNEVDRYIYLQENHSFIIERKLLSFIKELLERVQNSIEKKEVLELNKEEAELIGEILFYSWEDSLKYENNISKKVYQKALSKLTDL